MNVWRNEVKRIFGCTMSVGLIVYSLLTMTRSGIFTIIVGLRLMKNSIHRIVFGLILLMLVWANGFAQKTYFVYLQSETQQPFYVLYNSKNFSSSASGYLILPKLTDGTYAVRVGFPNNSNVQNYDLKVKGDDAGYLIKNFGEKGWGISDLQTGLVQMSGEELAKKEAVAAANKELENKRVADSLQALAVAAASAHTADSLLAVQKQKSEDSAKAAVAVVAAPVAAAASTQLPQDSVKKEEQKDGGVAAVAIPAALVAVAAGSEKASKDTATKEPAQEQDTIKTETAKKTDPTPAAAAVVPVTAVTVAAADSAATSNFKSEGAEPAKQELSAEEKHKADSLHAVAEQKKADSIHAAAMDAEAQRKIDEAREVMNRTLKQPGQTGSTGAVVAGAAVTGAAIVAADNNKNETKTAVPDSAASSTKSETAPAQDSVVSDTIVVKVPNKTANVAAPVAVVAAAGVAGSASKTSEPKFLDMEMGADSTQPSATKTAAPAAAPTSTSTKSSGSTTTGGLTSNNANTKIVTTPAAAGAAGVAAGAAGALGSEQKPQNANCKAEATEKDFFALRKKMVAEDDPDEMLNAARKAFKEKCYTTQQVKNLSVLLLTDETKYRFLDLAYGYTSDPQQFKTLADQLSDPYYVNRFKAMLKD